MTRRRSDDVPDLEFDRDPKAADAAAAGYRGAIQAAVREHLSPAAAAAVRFSSSLFPAIENLEDVLRAERGLGLGGMTQQAKDDLFKNRSHPTEVELADGMMPAMVRAGSKRGAASLFSAAEGAAIFEQQIAPVAVARGTRQGYWLAQKKAVTWAIAHDVDLSGFLPMSTDALKSLSVELLITGNAPSTIRNVWSGIETWHRDLGLPPPLGQPRLFGRMARAVGAIGGAPARLAFPLSRQHVADMLQLTGLTPAQRRNVLAVATGSGMCGRPSEISAITMCEVRWDFDAGFAEEYRGSLAIGVPTRKQDRMRRGLWPRLSPGPLVEALRRFTTEQRLAVRPGCTKSARPAARCRVCSPLFPNVVYARDHIDKAEALRAPMSAQQVSTAVKAVMGYLGLDASHYSGVSMRRGGISAAVAARVPEPILYLQSGHGLGLAGRNYVCSTDPRVLYDTARAMGL